MTKVTFFNIYVRKFQKNHSVCHCKIVMLFIEMLKTCSYILREFKLFIPNGNYTVVF